MKLTPDDLRQNEAGLVSRELMEEIHAFFDAADPDSFKIRLFNILLAYGGHYYYNAGEPIEVVETFDRLGQLLAGIRTWAGTLPAPSADSPVIKSCPMRASDLTLTDPVQVLVHFFEDGRYRNIESTLRSLRFFSLCRQSGIEDGAAVDTLKFYHDMTRLVEACDCIRKGVTAG
ncbi:MAG: hypothetical protein ABS46_04620 [Cytophagaceae bacterium SCN 52-12]|nr:MAG: hypothetical protein ABS46_04620 [Cytophagaceae bacterium SCN 52-12]